MTKKNGTKKKVQIDELAQAVIILRHENQKLKREYEELSDDYIASRFKNSELFQDFPVNEMIAIMAAAKRRYVIGPEAEMLRALCDTVESWLRENDFLAAMTRKIS